MSIHFLECAANLDLQPSTKLALMAFADSADRQTRVAYPGLDQVMRWSGLGRSRASEVIAELTELGLLRKLRGGHRGRRAEFAVFPEGCCAEHPIAAEDATDDPELEESKGSGGPESLSVKGSGGPDPIGIGSAGPDPLTGKGSGKGPVGRTPSLTTTTTPLTPASGGASCAKPGPTPHTNCRGCGTTNRQLEQQRIRDEAAQRREAAAAAAEAERLALEAFRVPTEERPPEIAQALRAGVAASRERFHLAKAGKR